jgi:hypothetical protein
LTRAQRLRQRKYRLVDRGLAALNRGDGATVRRIRWLLQAGGLVHE